MKAAGSVANRTNKKKSRKDKAAINDKVNSKFKAHAMTKLFRTMKNQR